jgi:PAS domain S-box-containing protein
MKDEQAHSLAMMRAALEASTDGILVTNERGEVTHFNENYVRMWQMPREVLEAGNHKKLQEIIAQRLVQTRPYFSRIEEIYATAPPESFDLLEFKDGRVFERHSRIQFVDRQNVGRVWSFRNITERRDVERKLRDQAEWFSVILSSIGDAVITTDTAGRVTYLNSVAEQLTGWNLTEATGQPLEAVFNIVNEASRRPAENPVRRVLSDGVTMGLANHTVLIARDGREIAIEDSAAPIKNPAGEILGVVVVFHDVTGRRKTEKALELLSRLPEENPSPVMRLNHGGILTFVNPAALNHFAELHLKVGELAPSEMTRFAANRVSSAVETTFLNRTYQVMVTPVDDADYVNLYFSDVTARRQAELERERLASVLERSLNEIYIFDPLTLRFEFVNEGALRNLGYSREEIRHLTPLELKPEFNQTSYRQHIEPLLSGQMEKRVFETVQLRKDGTLYPVEVHLQQVAHGERRFMLAVILDITERKKAVEELRHSEQELRALADSMAQLAWIAAPDGHIFWYNRRWYDYTGTTLEQMQGWGWQAVHDPGVLPSVMERWTRAIRLGEAFEMEFPLRGADGTFRRFLTRANPLRDQAGQVIRWFGTNTDIEQSKLAEEALAVARDIAEQANRAKDHFLAALSHELRTPLTPVLALLSGFEGAAGVPREFADQLETIRRNVELEVRLIDDLLDLTRVTRGKLDLHYRHSLVSEIIEAAINTCQSDLQARRISLTREMENASQEIFADTTRVTQILWNLLKNAIKFTPTGGDITIRAHSGQANQLIFEVQDSGMGIEASQISRIFGAFEQGDPKINRQFGGLGLGLAISRAIAEAHQGMLTVASQGLGRGSTFTLSLPSGILDDFSSSLNPPSDTKIASPDISDGCTVEQPLLRILLVEDHVDTASSLSLLLRRRGYDITLAVNAADAIKLVAQQPFDLLVSDLGLPDATGYDLMKQIGEIRPMPGIALSGFGMEEDIQRCYQAGFSEHLVKPVHIAKLQQTIEKLRRRH